VKRYGVAVVYCLDSARCLYVVYMVRLCDHGIAVYSPLSLYHLARSQDCGFVATFFGTRSPGRAQRH